MNHVTVAYCKLLCLHPRRNTEENHVKYVTICSGLVRDLSGVRSGIRISIFSAALLNRPQKFRFKERQFCHATSSAVNFSAEWDKRTNMHDKLERTEEEASWPISRHYVSNKI
jgi:hypothetical protein